TDTRYAVPQHLVPRRNSVRLSVEATAVGSLQRKASWLFTFLLRLSTLVLGASVLAQATYPDRLGPDKGGFDWTRFEGKYDFNDDQSRPSAMGGNNASDTPRGANE